MARTCITQAARKARSTPFEPSTIQIAKRQKVYNQEPDQPNQEPNQEPDQPNQEPNQEPNQPNQEPDQPNQEPDQGPDQGPDRKRDLEEPFVDPLRQMPKIVFKGIVTSLQNASEKETREVKQWMLAVMEAARGCADNGLHWRYEEEDVDGYMEVVNCLNNGDFKNVEDWFCTA